MKLYMSGTKLYTEDGEPVEGFMSYRLHHSPGKNHAAVAEVVLLVECDPDVPDNMLGNVLEGLLRMEQELAE